jgi:hypothetical protein
MKINTSKYSTSNAYSKAKEQLKYAIHPSSLPGIDDDAMYKEQLSVFAFLDSAQS